MPPVRDCTAPPEAGKPNCGHATAPRPCYLGVGGITFVSQNPTAEYRRLSDSADRRADWKNWGPYLAERGWGTVREDYRASGDGWNHFPHDHPRSRAYRWNEGGLAGYYNCFSESLPVSYGRSLDASLLVHKPAGATEGAPLGPNPNGLVPVERLQSGLCPARGVVQESRCELDP